MRNKNVYKIITFINLLIHNKPVNQTYMSANLKI